MKISLQGQARHYYQIEEALDCCVNSAFSQKPSSLYPVQSYCKQQTYIAWGVGLCQLFKELLVYSMRSVHIFFFLEQGQQLDTPTNSPRYE